MKYVWEIALGYFLLVLGMFIFQRSFMYFPDKVATEVPNSVRVNVETDDGFFISSFFLSSDIADSDDTGRKVIVFFHGNAGNASHRFYKARIFLDAGYDVLLAEYRGYGGNPGAPNENGLYADARAQIDFLLEKRGFAQPDLILYGESIGSAVAVQMAVEYSNVFALVLETPFSSMVDVARNQYFFLPVNLLLFDRFMSAQKIGALSVPVLIGHGTKDNIVPYDNAERLYRAVRSKYKGFKTYDGADHNNLYNYGFGSDVIDFLSGIHVQNIDNK